MKSLTDKELALARQQIDDAVRPLIFFHDDPDGLASYLQLYKKIGDGKGIPIKTTPIITTNFLRYVDEFNPDRLFIVDIAVVEQDFLDEVKVPVTWIDHHQLLDRDKVTYFNPRKNHPGVNIPASQVVYEIIKENDWIAMIGIIGDWVLPEMAKEFSKENPDLLPPKTSTPETALFKTKIGYLTNMFSFLLKGKIKDVKQSIGMLAKIKNPRELLDGTSEKGEVLIKRFEPVWKEYQSLLKEALYSAGKDLLLCHIFGNNRWSFTKEISNEVYYNHPDKFILIGRENEGIVKMSLRWSGNIPPILSEALNGLEGRGGGHEHACGAVVSKEDFEEFRKRIIESIS